MNISKWKMYRVIYDYDGMYFVEGDTADAIEWKRALAEAKNEDTETSWIIGEPVKRNGDIIIKTILQGSKQILEMVLKLLQAEDVICTTTRNSKIENLRS